jgi:hypothetical protein
MGLNCSEAVGKMEIVRTVGLSAEMGRSSGVSEEKRDEGYVTRLYALKWEVSSARGG